MLQSCQYWWENPVEFVLGDFKHLEAGKIGDRRRNGPGEAVKRNLYLLDAGKACPQVVWEAAVQAVVGLCFTDTRYGYGDTANLQKPGYADTSNI